MEQEKAREIASVGFSLVDSERIEEAEKKYREAVKLVDPTHWSTQDIHGEYALILKKLDKPQEALCQLQLALESALRSDKATSNGVTVARHFLAKYLMELGEPKNALQSLLPVLSNEVELKWLLHYSAANAYYQLGEEGNFELQAAEVVKTAPAGKFLNNGAVRNQILSNAKSS